MIKRFFSKPVSWLVLGAILAVTVPVTANVVRKFRGESLFDSVNATALKINNVSVTSTAAELNALDGITATVAELNALDGITATVAELNALDGITSNVSELNALDGITADVTELNLNDGQTATASEVNAAADLSAQGVLLKVKKLSISSTPTGAEQDTGWDLPASGVVFHVYLDVTTAEATAASKLIDVGLLAGESGGDTNGFITGLSVASTGRKIPGAVLTAGGNETYFSSNTKGALLASFLAGSDVATDVGTYMQFPHAMNGTAVSVVYDADGADWNEFRGDIYIVYAEQG